MKKIVLAAVAVILCVYAVQAQTDVFANGEHVKYDIDEKTRGIIIHKYDDDNNKLFSKVVPVFERYKLKSGPYGDFHINQIRQFGNKYYILYKCYNYKEKYREVLACRIHTDLSVDSPMLIWNHPRAKLSVSEFEDAYFFKSENGKADGYYFSHNLFGEDKETITLVTYDEDLNKRWQQTYVLPALDKDARMKSMQITDDGLTMIGTLEMKEPSEPNSSTYERDKRHFRFTENGFEEITFAPGNNAKIWDWKMRLLGNGKAFMAGVYLDTLAAITDYAVTGIVSAYYDIETNKWSDIHYNKFPDGFIANMQGKIDRDKKITRNEYVIPGIHVKANGEIDVKINRYYYIIRYVGSTTQGVSGYSENRENGGSFNVLLNIDMTELKLVERFINPFKNTTDR